MKYRIGEMLHACWINDETGRPSYSQYVVRTKRGGRFHAILKDEYTWVRLKRGKDKTMCWAKSIPAYCRESCEVGEKFRGLFRTKKQALAYAKKSRQRFLRRDEARAAQPPQPEGE